MSINEPLEAALRAATAPGHPEELAGEDAVVAAFRAAAPVPRHRPLLARLLTVKALVIGFAAVSTAVVLVTAGVLSFLPSREPATVPPAETSVVTNEGSEPVVPPPDSPTSTTSPPATTTTRPPESSSQTGPGDRGSEPDRKEDGPGHDKGHEKDKDVDPRSPNEPDDPNGPNDQNGRTQTPGSPAQGAVTAVPPSGAKPPPSGG